MQWLNLSIPDLTLWLFVGVFAAHRITMILYEEHIAWPLRKLIGIDHIKNEKGHKEPHAYPDTFLGKLFICPDCLSVYVGIGVIFVIYLFPYALIPFAVSNGVIILELLISRIMGQQ